MTKMKKILLKILLSGNLVMLALGLMAQTHVATQHRSTESVRLKDVTVTDIVTTVDENSTDAELPTAQAVYEALGSGSSIGVEFEYEYQNDVTPASGKGYFKSDSIIIHLTDRRGINVDDAIDGATGVNVRTDNSYISYTIDGITWDEAGQYYFIKLNLGKGSLPDPVLSSIRYLTFEKSNIVTPPNDTTPDANLLGYEFQYNTSASKIPTAGTIDIGNDSIQLWKLDRRSISVANVLPLASHIQIRNDSIMVAYEIASYTLISDSYYRILLNVGKGTPDEPQAEDVTFVSFIFSTGTGTGFEKVTENGKTGWRFIDENPDIYDVTGEKSFNAIISETASNYAGVTGDYSNGLGYYNKVTGTYGSNVNGNSNLISGNFGSNANGNTNYVTGDYASNANGRDNAVGGDNGSNANGWGNVINGSDASNVNGYDNEVSGSFGANANGYKNIAQNHYQTSLGKHNKGSSATTIFEVGIGTATNTRANGIEVHTTGEVNIPNFLKLEPTQTPFSPSAGILYTDASTGDIMYYDGSGWVNLTLSAAGITNINDALDIDISGITDWSVPKWSSSTGKWIMDIDSTSAGVSSDYKIKLNASDAAPNYLDTKLAGGDLITLSNSSNVKTINVAKAASSDVLARSVVDKAVTPDLVPVFGSLNNSDVLDELSGADISAANESGIYLRQYTESGKVKIGAKLFTGNLTVKNRLALDFDDYVIVNTNINETVRLKIGELYQLLQAAELEMTVLPKLNYNLGDNDGWSNGAAFSAFTFDRIIQINEWDGTQVSLSSGTLSFANEVNCSVEKGTPSDSYSANITVTVNAGTYANDGTVYGSVDLVFTHSSTEYVVRKTIRIYHNGIIR